MRAPDDPAPAAPSGPPAPAHANAHADTHAGETTGFVPASLALQQLRDQITGAINGAAPGATVGATNGTTNGEPTRPTITLDWLLGSLQRRSFGMVVLLLALVGLLPGLCNIAGVLLMIAAAQMLLGRAAPRFPQRIAARNLPAAPFISLINRTLPVLRRLETMIHPRWPVAMALLDRVSGIAILFLGLAMSTIPIPLSNIAPALAISLIALATLEADGLLLVAAMALATLMLVVEIIALSQALIGAAWISRLW